MSSTPQLFAAWMHQNRQVGKKCGHTYLYHSRSNTHSIALGQIVVADLMKRCSLLAKHAANGKVGYGLDLPYCWLSGKEKTLDIAIGTIDAPSVLQGMGGTAIPLVGSVSRLLVACEQKACMTEHGKSQPRIYDELSSSHEIVHQGDQQTIACGLTAVNIGKQFVSPLRQVKGQPLVYSAHNQPHVTEKMVNHLRRLPIRDQVGQVGFDAYCTFTLDTDNVNGCSLHTAPPAPQAGDRDHYETFITRIAAAYEERFAGL